MEKLSNSTRFEMRFSIVIPSYNQGRFIERTLRSVLGQNVDLEIIVVDGGSTDETVSILQKYDEKISWKSGEDGGQADAINRGLRESKGDVLAYLNSDDVYYPGALERVESHSAWVVPQPASPHDDQLLTSSVGAGRGHGTSGRQLTIVTRQ